MLKVIVAGFVMSAAFAGAALAQTCPAYTYTFTNGSTADAAQVNANFNTIRTCVNSGLVASAGGTLTGGTIAGATTNSGTISGGTLSGITLGGTTTLPGSGIITSTGNIGIGTTNPTSPLFISSNAWPAAVISGTGGAIGVRLINSAYSAGNFWDFAGDAAGGLSANHNGADIFWLGRSGGTAAQFAGPAYSPSFVSTSDARLKENTKTLDQGALGIVQQLRPVSFAWKKATDEGMRGEQIGFIAQEVQKVLPGVVTTGSDKEKTLGIKYTEIIPILTKAIQEQQAEIEALKVQVTALKSNR